MYEPHAGTCRNLALLDSQCPPPGIRTYGKGTLDMYWLNFTRAGHPRAWNPKATLIVNLKNEYFILRLLKLRRVYI